MIISVIITAYKSHAFIKQCLDSICYQSVDEVLLGIDGCNDVKQVIQSLRYQKLKVFMFEKTGTYIIRNTLAQQAQGTHLLFIDSDDVAGPDMITKLKSIKTDIVRFHFWDFKKKLAENIPNYNKVACGCFMITKDAFLQNNGFYPLPCSADYEFKLRTENQIKTTELKERLFYRRTHPGQLTANDEFGMHTKARHDINKMIPEMNKSKPNQLTTSPFQQIKQKLISFNIATYPPRIEQLKEMLKSVYDQADVIRIYLNEYDFIPEFLTDPKIEVAFQLENIMDTGKFYWAETLKNEYYFTADDDIVFDSDYADETIRAMQASGVSVCTIHGRVMNALPESPSDAKMIKHFFADTKESYYCNYAGTGVTCIDNANLAINKSIFETNGMTDQYFAVAMQLMRIPILNRAHKAQKSLHTPDALWSNRAKYAKLNKKILQSVKWKVYQ